MIWEWDVTNYWMLKETRALKFWIYPSTIQENSVSSFQWQSGQLAPLVACLPSLAGQVLAPLRLWARVACLCEAALHCTQWLCGLLKAPEVCWQGVSAKIRQEVYFLCSGWVFSDGHRWQTLFRCQWFYFFFRVYQKIEKRTQVKLDEPCTVVKNLGNTRVPLGTSSDVMGHMRQWKLQTAGRDGRGIAWWS